ncbi:MAG TPA: hypothetical protein VF754_08335 [Pyrinomonadaceae bacterium]
MTLKDFFGETGRGGLERRSLPRLAPASRIWVAVENTTRNELLGMAEVADFSGLGMALRGLAGDPVAALGDKLRVTVIAEEGIIPLQARLVRIRREGVFGLTLEAPSEPGQCLLLRMYEHAAALSPTDEPRAASD